MGGMILYFDILLDSRSKMTTDLTGNNSFEKLDKVTNLNQRIKFIEISNFCECPFIRMD